MTSIAGRRPKDEELSTKPLSAPEEEISFSDDKKKQKKEKKTKKKEKKGCVTSVAHSCFYFESLFQRKSLRIRTSKSLALKMQRKRKRNVSSTGACVTLVCHIALCIILEKKSKEPKQDKRGTGAEDAKGQKQSEVEQQQAEPTKKGASKKDKGINLVTSQREYLA